MLPRSSGTTSELEEDRRTSSHHQGGVSKNEEDSFSSCSKKSTSSNYAIPYLFELITKKEWDTIRGCLMSSLAVSLCQERDNTNLSCLALALAYQAPLDIIEHMIQIDPSPLTSYACDDYGATPLHVGCLNGASLESLDLILRKYKHLVTMLDCDQRAPLHHAVEYACDCCGGNSTTLCDSSSTSDDLSCNSGSSIECEQEPGTTTRQSYSYCVRLLEMLCKAAPEVVHVQDNNGKGLTPLDIVQIYKAKRDPDSEEHKKLHSLYEVLRDTSILVYRTNKLFWEEEETRVEE